jgi:hypothetical protein
MSRSRRCIENSFGILVSRWRILLKAIETNEENAISITKAATVLHNFTIEELKGI